MQKIGRKKSRKRINNEKIRARKIFKGNFETYKRAQKRQKRRKYSENKPRTGRLNELKEKRKFAIFEKDCFFDITLKYKFQDSYQ